MFRLRERRTEERKPTTAADVQIDNRLYKVADISLHGLYVTPYEGSVMPGERFNFRLFLVLSDGPYDMQLSGKAVRFDRRGMGVRFNAPRGRDYRALLRFLRS